MSEPARSTSLSSSPQTHEAHLPDPHVHAAIPQQVAPHHTHEAFALLAAGIPLTLLIDLATAVDSTAVYGREPGAADWLRSAPVLAAI